MAWNKHLLFALCLGLVFSSVKCLQVRTPAPAWSGTALVGDKFQPLSNEDFKGKWLVLFFYPLDFTFVCPTEIVSYSEAAKDELSKINTQVVGVSVDSKFTHLAFSKTARELGGLGGVDIPLVADITKEISRAYHVLDEIPGNVNYLKFSVEILFLNYFNKIFGILFSKAMITKV
uniref:Thioredoxin domain-containing protein n=1 Tax=Aplanochytrium stocchinoi TaxID=215587 RepID=A0A7S3LTQ5_9STRA|mmetsp:Transcript_20359/g.24714  ORF Transcript_20359/g.24714 Transcript_20359/m.24714 type:complete len:175 (+) Transcript_20359:311-835(+)